MTCTRCGQTGIEGPSCPRCGVIFAKLRDAPRPSRLSPSDTPHREGIGPLGWLALGLAAVLTVAWFFRPRPMRPLPSAASSSPSAAHAPGVGRAGADVAEAPPPALPSPPGPPFLQPLPSETVAVSETDRAALLSLARKINGRQTLADSDVKAAEELLTRHPGQKAARDLLEAVLIASASQQKTARRFPEAIAQLRRAAEIQPRSLRPRVALMSVLLESGDWAQAEATARDVLSLDPRDMDALRGLGYALFRQDRNREAMDVLNAALAFGDDPAARDLIARIQKGMADERGMRQHDLAHFHVRYDGDAHEDVGREILRALERHYATLATTLDYQPTSTVPVILFSREQYYDASGAPAWSGGVYDLMDGRIRLPIGGLTSSLTPDMDGTLIHELTHAFLADRTRGAAPRDVHEGLAQYMEGKRVESMLRPEQVTALVDGRIGGVGGFYLAALSFVEYLMSVRGQGGMNDLLKAMGETGNVNEAFRQVHGQDYRAVLKAWENRMRQRHGS